MKTKTIINIASLCLLVLAVFACASGDRRGLAVEEDSIVVFPQLGHTESIYSVVFSPDGRQVLSGSMDDTIRLWDVATGREIRTFAGHTHDVNSVAFSPDGRQVLSGSDDETVRLWDADTGRVIRIFTGHTKLVSSVMFSADGRQILSSSTDDTVKLWDAATGREIRTFAGYRGIFSPDCKQILLSTWETHYFGRRYEYQIRLLDVDTGRIIRTFSGKTGVFSPDGSKVLSKLGDEDQNAILWDTATGREIRTFSGHTKSISSLAFSPDSKQILTGSNDKTVRLWDADTGRVIRTFEGLRGIFSLDGRQVLYYPDDNSLKLCDAATGSEIITFGGQVERVRYVVFSPDAKHFLSYYYIEGGGGTNKLCDASTGKVIRTFRGHNGVFSPDGRQILSRTGNGVTLWDIETGLEIRTFRGSSGIFSPDGRQVLSNSGDDFRLWDSATGMEISRFTGQASGVLTFVLRHARFVFSPDGSQFLSINGGQLKLHDAVTGQEIRTFTERFAVDSVAFSPNGRQILSVTDTKFKLWDAETGREIRTFQGHTSRVTSVAFSPDGRQILSGSFGRSFVVDLNSQNKGVSRVDGTVRLWDAVTGREIRTFSRFTDQITSATFSPDGKCILASSDDGSIRLWDVATGRELVRFISFSGSDTQLAAASRGLTVETQTAAASNEGEWLVITPDGYYQASPRGDRYINVRVNNTVSGIDSYRSILYNPDVVQARLQGLPDPASKATFTIQQAADFIPPEVAIQSPANFTDTNTRTTNLSVAITSTNQPIRNIKILVNGRLIGKDELTSVTGTGLQAERASLTVTGNQKTVNFTLPLELEPGNNRIEVVAFNGYSENRRYVDVTRNAPAGERPPLPNLWIVAVGVNGYDNAGTRLGGLTNLNFAVADAKGLIDSLKAQEGRRYARVNSMLIADGERLAPTTENIRQGFRFLEGADPRRDVVVLFLAGHGISGQGGLFYFLPKDAAMGADRVVDASRAISGDEIMTVLDAPGNRLVFIDACQSGGVDNDRMVRSLMGTNAFVFAASRGNELSYEDARLGHGYFTYSIMSALGGAPAALAQGNVSVLSMSGYVKDDVPRRTNGRQNPSAYSLGFYDFPVAVIGR